MRLLTLVLVALALAVPFIRPWLILTNSAAAPWSDFDIFHASALATLAGDAVKAYDESWFRAFEVRTYGKDFMGSWSYPPPYDLVIAPFGLLSRGWALLIFMQLTLVAYLLTLRRVAGPWWTLALLLLLPVIMMVVFFGQNGLLTGALIGLACVGLAERKAWAGVPLGLMIIKPHLAIGMALYVVLSRDWRTFWTAGGVVAASMVVATLVLGTAVWPAFVQAAGAAGERLSSGYYPFFRLISAYAAARSWGASPDASMAAQLLSALLVFAIIFLAQRRLSPRHALGMTAIAGLLISPYAYDYDLPVAGMALALLLPDLARLGRPVELALVYALFLGASVHGTLMLPRYGLEPLVSIAAPMLFAVLALLWRILRRDGQAEASPA